MEILYPVTIAVLFCALGIALYVIKNLLKKVEVYEDDILRKDEYIDNLKKKTEAVYKKAKGLDSVGAFEADDELGAFFKYLKDSIFSLTEYYKIYEKPEEGLKN